MKHTYFIKAIVLVLTLLFSTVFIPTSLSAFSDDIETVFSDDFNDNSLDFLNWTEDVVGESSFNEINQEANFTVFGNHSYLISNVLSITNWKTIEISWKWKCPGVTTAEMICYLFDNDSGERVGVAYDNWFEQIRYWYSNAENDEVGRDSPENYVRFNISLNKTNVQYWEDGVLLNDHTSSVLSSTTNFRLRIGGWDTSSIPNQIFYFDDIWINVTYLDSFLVPSIVYIDDDFNETTPGWNVTNFSSIQAGINAVNETGTVAINAGIYNEFIIVNKTINIIGNSVDDVLVNGSFSVQRPNVIITGLTIVNATGEESAGVNVQSSDAILMNLKIRNCNYGIFISGETSGTNITACTIENNTNGLYLSFTFSNIILDNFLLNNSVGIYLEFSNENIIVNNYFNNLQNVEIIDEVFSQNLWNYSSILPGLNIIGGANLGGNYWVNYMGMDNNADGIGDTPYLFYFDEGENSYYDFFPLTFNVNAPPLLGSPDPIDESTNNPLELNWSIPISDDEGWFSWTIRCSNGQTVSSGEDNNGTKTLVLTDLSYGSTYTIEVNVTDWILWTNQTFIFSTKEKPHDPKPNPPKGNDPPVARAAGPYYGNPNEQLMFDGSSSFDLDGYIVSYEWNLGDGTTAQGERVTHSYTDPGSYSVSLLVTDNKGKTDSSTTNAVIVKANNPPEIESDVSTSLGKLPIQLTITVIDLDEDLVSCSISWGDGSSSSDHSMESGESHTQDHIYPAFGTYEITITADDGTAVSTKKHAVTLYVEDADDSSSSGLGGFSQISSEDDEFIENQIEDRSLFGQALDKKYVIPAATAASILLLFLLNLLIEFVSDYSSEHALDFRAGRKKKEVKEKSLKKFLSKGELFAVFVATVLLSFVLTWTWVPDMSMFWSLFFITLIIVALMFLIRESLRCYLCRKQGLYSEFYIWPLGGVMMLVSTFLGNTFSLAANHEYDEKGDIRKCGRINFIVLLFMFLIVLAGFGLNLLYPSVIFQMIVIVTVLNVFIDLFPFRPMDGFEIRKWNVFVWFIFYVIVIAFYVLVYFNLYP